MLAKQGVPANTAGRRTKSEYDGQPMTQSSRILLNPCDYLYYAHHRMLERTVRIGNFAYMMMDAEGQAEPELIRDALAAAMAAHPVTMAPLRISLFSGHPYWRIPTPRDFAARLAVEQAYRYDDLRTVSDWQTRLEQLCLERYSSGGDLASGPQVRLEHYALPENRTRFRLSWPHLLMDAEGAQWFLLEIARHSQALAGTNLQEADKSAPAVPTKPPTSADDQTMDVLAGRSFMERLRLFRQGFAHAGEHKGLTLRPIVPHHRVDVESFGLTHLRWNPTQVAAIQARAKSVTPPGPALYARYLAARVVRALHRIYGECGVTTDAYLITFPTRPSLPQAGAARPVPGNYLVSPVLCVRRESALDDFALGSEISRQLEIYRERHGDLTQWAMVWLASFLRASAYDWILRLPLGFESLTSGFSYYGEISPPVRSFGGTKIINFYGGGPLTSPPGWNPVFSRYEEELNLSLTWNRPAMPDELAHRYAQLIEEEVLPPA
jgi:hypothetical protein